VAELYLSLDAFIRSVGISQTPHTLFLGAGASVTSGMPSAQMCIWEWKRDIFLTNNIGLETQFSELSLASVRERIQRWLDRQGLYPAQGAPDEYGVYIEACYPIPESRRAYFQQKVRLAKPHTGYELLSVLAEHGLIRSVWTTNFDQLASRALANSNVAPIEIGIDSAHRILRPSKTGELAIVSLHGDYRYDRLKNTSEEIRDQESRLEAGLVEDLRNAPTIVCGYSGRDESIMDALSESLEQSGSGSIYWCVQDSTSVAKPVTELIERARAQGRTAYLVGAQGFDDLMIRLALHCLGGSAQAKATALIAKNSGGSDAPRAPFRIELKEPGTIIKSNAFEIDCPSEVLECELKQWPKEHAWRWVREQTADRNVVAVPFKGKVFALGTMDDLRACFDGNIKEGPRRTKRPRCALVSQFWQTGTSRRHRVLCLSLSSPLAAANRKQAFSPFQAINPRRGCFRAICTSIGIECNQDARPRLAAQQRVQRCRKPLAYTSPGRRQTAENL